MRYWRPFAEPTHTPFCFIDGASGVHFLTCFAPEWAPISMRIGKYEWYIWLAVPWIMLDFGFLDRSFVGFYDNAITTSPVPATWFLGIWGERFWIASLQSPAACIIKIFLRSIFFSIFNIEEFLNKHVSSLASWFVNWPHTTQKNFKANSFLTNPKKLLGDINKLRLFKKIDKLNAPLFAWIWFIDFIDFIIHLN